ncbi:AP-4 complex accessory subunit RUSC2 isoform X2 [Ambystoma mexicanum]
MASPPKLTGETLIVHHIPLVHCQVPDRQCCSSSKRTNPFCQRDLGITRTTSLPERHLSQTDSLLYSSLVQAFDPCAGPSEEAVNQARALKGPVVNRRHNPFLLGDNEDEGENSDAVGQASFHLHNAVVSRPALQANDLNLSPFHLHETGTIVKPWNVPNRSGLVDGQEAKLLADSYQRRNNVNQGQLAHDFMDMDEYSCHHEGASIFSLDCGDQDWNNSSDESMRNQEILHSRTCSCSSSELQHCRCYSMSSQSEIMDQQMGYISDSSCNSSDGVLVNFSALYNKMNGHTRSNMNSGNLSCDSSFCSHSDTGAFYLDLHSSPAESKMSCESHPPESSEKACGCHRPSSPLFDANCNSYHLHCDPMPCPSESSDLTSCFQSQARLVVATQNYYKLVTCDLSSQSSPSPAGSSITSCSEDPTKGSPVQPTEYYLFRRPEQNQEKNHSERFRERSHRERVENAIEGQVYVNVSPPNPNTGRQRSRSYDRSLDRSPPVRLASLERMMSCPVKLSDSQALSTRSSTTRRVTSFAELAKTRKKASFSPPNRMSGDSSLEFSPIPEFQKDRLVFADDGEHHSRSLPAMPFIHCLDRSCEDCDSDPGYGEGQRASSSNGSGSSDDSFPGNAGSEHVFHLELLDSGTSGLGRTNRDGRAKADGVVADSKSVFRYSKDQRPTTLPIQPFVFQHHFSKQVPKVHPLHSHFASSLSQLYSLSGHRAPSTQTSDSQSSTSASSAGYTVAGAGPAQTLCNVSKRSADGTASTGECSTKKLAPETTRPSPLGSYSPVRNNVPFFESMDSSSSSPTPERANEFHPPRSRSCPMSANLLSTRASPARGVTLPGAAQTTQPRKTEGLLLKEAPKMAPKKDAVMERNAHVSKYAFPPSPLPPVSSTSRVLSLDGGHLDRTNGNCEDPGKNTEENSMVPKHIHANHLSPQALKWREYRRRNPLGLERVSGLAGLAGSLDRKQQEPRSSRRSHLFDFPGGVHAANITSRLNGHSVKQLQINYSDFFPDYFSLTEKPPAEFCLSPDSTTESVSIDLMQKKGLVKAINTAVDLIVAHFGTSRDPGVKAKLGNSSVSPNVGHLILKYLCPAIRNILGDGLKAYVLDMIIGQRRNTPWSVVEASTQLGPSTKVLHSLFCKISQYSELTNHTMRFNAFIFGLLNIRSLEFWVNHLYNHEDIILAHFQPVGFMSLSHSICQVLIEEVLLLLQPLSLLPFNLDLLFEHHLFQMGREQQQKKELLRGKQDLQHSVHSTLQLMRTRGSAEDSSGGSAEDSSGRCDGTEDAKRDDEESIPQSLGLEKVKYERINGVGASVGESEKDEERKKVKESSTEVKKDKQAGWWYQLMQSSQVYIEGSGNGPKFVRYEKKKKPGAVTSVKETETRKAPPPREGVVDGAEDLAYVEGGMGERERQGICMEAAKQTVKDSRTQEPKEKNRPSWMGSPPESVLNEIKGNSQKEKRTMQESHTTEPKQETEEDKKDSPVTSEGSSSMKWGRLFGSRKQHVEGRPTNRLPSNWLSLDSSMLQFMAQTVSAGIWRDTSAEGEKLEKELLPEQLPSPSIVQPEGPPR